MQWVITMTSLEDLLTMQLMYMTEVEMAMMVLLVVQWMFQEKELIYLLLVVLKILLI